MDRFYWTNTARLELQPQEQVVLEQAGVRLYDGQEQTSFDGGVVVTLFSYLLRFGRL